MKGHQTRPSVANILNNLYKKEWISISNAKWSTRGL